MSTYILGWLGGFTIAICIIVWLDLLGTIACQVVSP